MDTLLELRDAFRNIILGYKNLKCREQEAFSDQVSVDDCLIKVKSIENSKSAHLNLFSEIIKSIDGLFQAMQDNVQETETELHQAKDRRHAYKTSLITIIQELYRLNHTTYHSDIFFLGTKHYLIHSRAYAGFGYALTELGQQIREHLLIPLSASGIVDESKVLNNIENILNSIFNTMDLKEELAFANRAKEDLEQKLGDFKRKQRKDKSKSAIARLSLFADNSAGEVQEQNAQEQTIGNILG